MAVEKGDEIYNNGPFKALFSDLQSGHKIVYNSNNTRLQKTESKKSLSLIVHAQKCHIFPPHPQSHGNFIVSVAGASVMTRHRRQPRRGWEGVHVALPEGLVLGVIQGVDQCPILINHSGDSGSGPQGSMNFSTRSTSRSLTSLLWVSLEATFTSLQDLASIFKKRALVLFKSWRLSFKSWRLSFSSPHHCHPQLRGIQFGIMNSTQKAKIPKA